MHPARHEAITSLAERLLEVAKQQYERAPKVILDASEVDPPPLTWHCAYTSGQVLELMLRLLVFRKKQVDAVLAAAKEAGFEIGKDEAFDKNLATCAKEANNCLKFFNIQLGQEV